jgi:F-type H+-transporting ATPase subunit delta
MTAEVKTAHALSAAQEKELKAALAGVTGKTVTLNVTSMHRCWAV